MPPLPVIVPRIPQFPKGVPEVEAVEVAVETEDLTENEVGNETSGLKDLKKLN